MQPDTTLPKDPRIGVYTALISQLSTANPNVTILQNTTGKTIIWTRDSVGEYLGTINEDIDVTKTTFECNNGTLIGWQFTLAYIDPGTIRLQTAISGFKTDGLLLNTFIQIKTY